MTDVDSIVDKLQKTTIPKESGVSFADKGLQFNTAEDAKQVCEAIRNCEHLSYLELYGNSLGVPAAEEIAKELANHSEYTKATWRHMFTGRAKTEIPVALKHLSKGLITAGAKLEVLDLSDNAAGPIGVDGFAELLKSPTCYTLKQLILTNMGLGVTGGKMLAAALRECLDNSRKAGTPLQLQVFQAGRNRLENEGSKALANVFKDMGSLEVVEMPQNGIYTPGIEALSEAFSNNPHLRIINLNDNTIKKTGAAHLAVALPKLQRLTSLDVGDCLLKTDGAKLIADALSSGFPLLQEVNVANNEIRLDGAIDLVTSLSKKPALKLVEMGGNRFGENGIKELRALMGVDKLGSMSEDEGDDDDDDEDDEGADDDYEDVDEEAEEEEEESDGDEGDEGVEEDEEVDEPPPAPLGVSPLRRLLDQLQGTTFSAVEQFLKEPTIDRLLALGTNRADIISSTLVSKSGEDWLDEMLKCIIAVSSQCSCANNLNKQSVLSCATVLYRELFTWAKTNNSLHLVNNYLPVYFGFIKSENKNKKISLGQQESCLEALNYAMEMNFFPKDTRDIMNFFKGTKASIVETGAFSP